jgi:hypothetical protein
MLGKWIVIFVLLKETFGGWITNPAQQIENY